MPLTINDATDAAHSAVMDVTQWAEEFEAEWLRPLMELEQAQAIEQVLQFWDSLPPEAHAQMEKQDPEQHTQVMKRVEELRKEVRKNGKD